MSFRSLFKRQDPANQPAPPSPGPDDDLAVQAARVQARRRLIGAVVLMAAGVIVFPLLFDGKPRPVPGDVRIELQRSEGTVAVKPLNPPGVAAPTSSAVSETTPRATVRTEATAEGVSEPAPASASLPAVPPAQPAQDTVVAAAPAGASAGVSTGASQAAPASVASKAPNSTVPPAKASPTASAQTASASRPAQAGGASAPLTGGRFVVQVGAFTDPVALREARQKVEKLGLKTYTQVIENDAGRRTRVRVGPFETRAEAEAAGVKIKAAGLPAYLLTL